MAIMNPDFKLLSDIYLDYLASLCTSEKLQEVFWHKKARDNGKRPEGYPERVAVSDSLVDWQVDWPDYKPPYFVASKVLDQDYTKKAGGWADPENLILAKQFRGLTPSSEELLYDALGYPLNPRGRTGLDGRGVLGKWGVNQAGDIVLSRINPEPKILEFGLGLRAKTLEWTNSGGMCEGTDNSLVCVTRELEEEFGVKEDLSDAIEIYRGPVDDQRATDKAWIETGVYHKHLSNGMDYKLIPDEKEIFETRWFAVSEDLLARLYASHGPFIRLAVKHLLEDLIPNHS